MGLAYTYKMFISHIVALVYMCQIMVCLFLSIFCFTVVSLSTYQIYLLPSILHNIYILLFTHGLFYISLFVAKVTATNCTFHHNNYSGVHCTSSSFVTLWNTNIFHNNHGVLADSLFSFISIEGERTQISDNIQKGVYAANHFFAPKLRFSWSLVHHDGRPPSCIPPGFKFLSF